MKRPPFISLGMATVAAAIGMLGGCGDDPAGPEIQGGAGIRIQLPEETRAWDRVQVELWDHDNGFADPPTCPETSLVALGPDRSASALADSCTRWAVEIWNYLGEQVLLLPDIPFRGGSFAWNRLDNEGNTVPAGIYPTEQWCLDSGGAFTLTANYLIFPEIPSLSCEWLLWSESIELSSAGNSMEFGPFPVFYAGFTYVEVEDQLITQDVFFSNPYTVRIRGPQGQLYEEVVELVDEEFVTVVVNAFMPAVPAGPPAATSTTLHEREDHE